MVLLTRRTMQVVLQFHGDLTFFLPADSRRQPIRRPLHEKTSIKDVIEACGVPHTEVDLILCDGSPVEFSHQLTDDAEIDVYSPFGSPQEFAANQLQQRGITKFVADGHLGKVARNLRLLGLDVAYNATADDTALLEISAREKRALLTRDRRLLMHAIVRDGYCPRSDSPEEQTVEVIRRFNLHALLAPFSRCLTCNGTLEPVSKAEVLTRLEPLTKIYYQNFRHCMVCGKIYWAGSHFGKLQSRIRRIRNAVGSQRET